MYQQHLALRAWSPHIQVLLSVIERGFLLILSYSAYCGIDCSIRFAPHQGIVTAYEQPHRQELCLNGKWQFQPIAVEEDFKWNCGQPPVLADPDPEKWEAVPIKIPSAWNVNNWGLWDTPKPFDPVPIYYPSYPESWKHARMGWLRKLFAIPQDWKGNRVILHFDGVAGQSRVVLNGTVVVDSHYDSFTPFQADVTDYIKWEGPNELLVGIRAHRLFNKAHPKYKWGWDAMGPRGSDMFDLCGIYQDVFLLKLPPVYIEDVFVKPWLDRNLLEAEIVIRNTTDESLNLLIKGLVHPWINLAGTDVLSAPEQKWTLQNPVMLLSRAGASLLPRESKTINLSKSVNGILQMWDMEHPVLYGLVLSVESEGRLVDQKYIRFGWRQFKIENGDIFLNGRRIRLYGDIMHPFSSFIMTRRTAWAWFTMIKDFGGNAVRLHAQPWPKFYVEMADEMGIAVLDETGIFGSAGGFNMDEDAAWKNCRDEYEALIRRDRNNPSVMGWSFANEMFALALLNKISEQDYAPYQKKLVQLGQLAYQLDPTRQWISCDGDEDMNGQLPVWSKHWGDGWKDKQKTHYQLPQDSSKPWMLGEYSGSYYAAPDRLDYLNGDRAYESYAGRAEALGIDIYELGTGLARGKLDYFSASEVVWFGLEHLNFGYSDFSRLPTLSDGVFFNCPYEEGLPGMQPERLPPFITTLNPGWDPSLPLYKPLPMFAAMKAALSPHKPADFLSRITFRRRPEVRTPDIKRVGFVGIKESPLYAFLKKHKLPLSDLQEADFVFIDAHTGLDTENLPALMDSLLSQGAAVMVMISNNQIDLDKLNSVLPAPIALTNRQASSFIHGTEQGPVAPFSLKELYFVENEHRSYVMQCGLDGPLVERSSILLEACNVDWTLFNAAENRKCAALILNEKLHKPSGAALIEWTDGKSKIYICTLDTAYEGEAIDQFWHKFFACLGIDAGSAVSPEEKNSADGPPHDLLRDGPPA